VRGQVVAVSLIALALILLPAFTPADNVLNWLFLALLYGTLAQSWNLLGGFAGQVNLGHAAFFGLGSLVTRTLWLNQYPLALALVAGTAVSTAMGVVIGAPSLRLRGPYFAIGTLAVAEILRITTASERPEISFLPSALLAGYNLVPRYYLALALVSAVTLVAWWLTRSRFGYGLAAVREDEVVAEAVGIHAFRHKLLAFVLSSLFAGMAGGLFAYYHVSYYLQFPFNPIWTFDALLITFLGGAGTVWGPLVGAGFFLLLRETLALRLVELHLLIFGIIFVLVVLMFPGGFMEAWRALAEKRLRSTSTTDPWKRRP
jgi:branched-chain amino acid transport system permease protein